MRHLILLRHAKAVASSPDGDFTRWLAPRGREQAAAFGRWLPAQGFAPDLVVSSPAVRASETADLALKGFAKPPARRDEPALYNATALDILAIARAAGGEARSLMIVGHNPGLAELAIALAGAGNPVARKSMAEKFPPCGCAVLFFPAAGGSALVPWGTRLEAFVTPKTLSAQ